MTIIFCLKRFHPVEAGLFGLLLLLVSTGSLADKHSEHTRRFRARHLSFGSTLDEDSNQLDEHRALFFTLSDDSIPVALPPFTLQFSGTTLSTQGLEIIEFSMKDFLRDKFEAEYEDAARVDIALSPPRDISRRHRILQTGQEVDVEATVHFRNDTASIPEDDLLTATLDTSLADMFTYIQNYLGPEVQSTNPSDTLAAVTEIGYQPTWTKSDLATPLATLAPSVAPAASPGFSQINEAVTAPRQEKKNLTSLYAAMVAGAAVFILTVLFLAVRRRRVRDENVDGGSELSDLDMDHISIDYDGKPGKEESNSNYMGNRWRETPSVPFSPSQSRSVQHMGPLQTVRMEDGATTLHIPPVTNSSSRFYTTSPVVMSVASSVGSSFDERDEYQHYISSRYSVSSESQMSADAGLVACGVLRG